MRGKRSKKQRRPIPSGDSVKRRITRGCGVVIVNGRVVATAVEGKSVRPH